MALIEKFASLESVLAKQIDDILSIVTGQPGTTESPFVMLPTGDDVDVAPAESAGLVARTSNEYAKACRLAGICRALTKIAEGSYKHKLKTSMANASAKNAAEREAFAYEQAKEEYNRFVLYSAVTELAESWEIATRIASESARKVYATNDVISKADGISHIYGDRVTKSKSTLEPW